MKAKSKKPTFNLREIKIHFGTFDFSAYVVICKDISEAYRYASYCHDTTWIEERSSGGYEARGKYFHRTGYCPIIWLPRFPSTPREYGTLAHEAMHVVTILMAWAGIQLNGDTDEVYCHALGHLVNSVLEAKKVAA
jgi:hypothetical protein